ncbi:MAG: hypothetical protein H6605_10085 [Flavobacteriales bacterium]|nr:hypothetical protein [Flavobacteriales bacterium]
MKVINSGGDNLIFGASSVYDPNDILIKNEFGDEVEFFANASNGTIDFTFNTNSETYKIELSKTDIETIKFTYGTDKQIDCCQEFAVTVTTSVNGKSIANNDLITIVR